MERPTPHMTDSPDKIPAPYTPRGFMRLHPTTRQLILARFLRSIAQGALAVDFVLFLHARLWTAPEIGLLLMGGGLAGAGLSLVVGVTSDKIGRKQFLLIYEIGLAIGTTLVIANHSVWILVLTAALFGFGRGANGASGPFAPAEQAWLAQHIPGRERGQIFSTNAALQFWGMGIGSLLGAFLPHIDPALTGALSYDPIFWLNLAVALINLVQIAVIPEVKPGAAAQASDTHPSGPQTDEHTAAAERQTEKQTRERENKALSLLVVVNALNALGVALVAPLLPYWFAVRFGVGPEAIGPVYGLTFILTGLSSLYVGKLSDRIGLTRSIVLPRILGVVLLVAMPFMPSFAIAAILYVLRSIVNRSSMGARQAFSVGLVRDQRRGLASSLNAVSWSLPASIGPAIGGWLLGLGSLTWPFLLAAVFQTSYIVLFPLLMGRFDEHRAARKPVSRMQE